MLPASSLTEKRLLLAGVAVLFLATGTALAGSLEEYRKPVCKTADDYAGCMANKKPQMWATDGIRWDCRHGFALTGDNASSGVIDDDQAEFIITIGKTPTYKACRAYQDCVSGKTKQKHCYANDKRWRDFLTGWW